MKAPRFYIAGEVLLAFRRVAESSVAESRVVRVADSKVAQSSGVAESRLARVE